MNITFEVISHGLHQIQRTFFPDLEQEAGPIPETLVRPPDSTNHLVTLRHPQFRHLIQQIHFDRHFRGLGPLSTASKSVSQYRFISEQERKSGEIST